MSASDRDLGSVDDIDVEAIGEPGHRTFRLLLETGTITAALWIEKEQLEHLATIIEQQVARVNRDRPSGPHPSLTLATRFPSSPSIELKVGRLGVGFDIELRKFVLTADSIEPDEPGLSCTATQLQAEALSTKIVSVAAAGRPRCPLCGAPMGANHVCPASNGHVHV